MKVDLAICTHDYDQPAPHLREQLHWLGDVIEAFPAGEHAFSVRELTHDVFRIIRTDLLPSTIEALTSFPFAARKKHMQRAVYLDLSKAPDPSLFTGKRQHDVIELTREQVMAMVTYK